MGRSARRSLPVALVLVSCCLAGEAVQAAKAPRGGGRLAAPDHSLLPPPPPACTEELRSRIQWGAATASYQIEGGWNEGGKGESVWDVWTHAGKAYQNATGDVACDFFHRWRDDVAMMKRLGLKHFRLSISWPRIVPGGLAGSTVNARGVEFYRRLLVALREAGIEPLVTLFHWDLPQALQDAYGGFASPRIADDFAYYAGVVFRELGALVTQWVTFNEPWVTCKLGFQVGTFPPGLQLGAAGMLRCGHHHLLAHARAVQLYRQAYASTRGGELSIAVPGSWAVPFDARSAADRAAAERMMVFTWAWMFDPLVRGDYPQEMLEAFGEAALPRFTDEERRLLRGSADFLAANVYTSRFAQDGWDGEMPWVESLSNASGAALGADTDVPWLKVTPAALRGVPSWLARRYGRSLPVRVTENGAPVPGESLLPVTRALRDEFRVRFYSQYLQELCAAVAAGEADVDAYYAWSLMDNLEWLDGYRPRFGVVYVDYKTQRRTPKLSAAWLSEHFFRVGR